MPAQAIFYTDAVEQQIIELRKEGNTAKEIAAAIGTTRNGLNKQLAVMRSEGKEVPAAGYNLNRKERNKNGKTAKPDKLTHLDRLKGTQRIHIAEHSRKIDTVIRVDHKTYIIKHKKTA